MTDEIKTMRTRMLLSIRNVGLNCGLDAGICRQIEDLCFKKTIAECYDDSRRDQLINRYTTIIGNITANIDPVSSINKKIPDEERLYKRLLAGKITVEEIVSAESFILNPSANKEIRDVLEKRENSKVEKNYADFPCKKCGFKKYILFRIQTRSLDEAADVYYLCENCGDKKF